jgi:hypothetical protein
MTLPLGRVFASIGVIAAFAEALETDSPDVYLKRHAIGDWGEVNRQDWNANEHALEHGLRVLSAYTLSTGEKIWIITEADRSSTMIFLPAEY